MLREKFSESLKEALKNKDQVSISTIRLIMAALKDRDIAERGRGNAEGLDNAGILSMLQGMVKQRQESIKMYDEADRKDLADREREEVAVIERFLPKQMDESESKHAVDTIIAEVGAESIKDMGKVMAELKGRYAGQMDFGRASGLVKERLSA